MGPPLAHLLYDFGQSYSIVNHPADYVKSLMHTPQLNLIEFPNDIEVYPLDADDLCSLDRYDGAHGQIALYPKHSELKRVTQGLAETMNKGPLSYSEFVKGNIVITIFPELAEEDAERFRHALESLE
jgi:hypothetical protein